MDPTIPTPTASSTITDSDISLHPPDFYVLNISLISAQDLAPISKSMRTYAVTWIHPSRKLTTSVDQQRHTNPLWNERFAFRVDSEFLSSDQAAITVEIYTVSWFRDLLVGTVRVLISDLITPCARNHTRYLALQIRRPSGNPQGMLNMGVALMDAANRSMPLRREMNPSVRDYQDALVKKLNSMSAQQKDGEIVTEENNDQMNEKIHLWRSYSLGSEFNEEFPLKAGSICNGNGSELCSDVGPSASIVAAEIARKSLPPMAERKIGNSIVEEMTVEEATAKGLNSDGRRHGRRHSDGGLFSCFGNAYGFEFTIVCGASNHGNKPHNIIKSRSQKKRILGSETNSA
ncbi:unnamed protein product [Coffea canephora]|uniref:C2 domain-containing protein n=1 Tax=Coffea canephora TaxID=49390 RepID=A0A068U7Y7_COFCA|nr:unnamed protein product [Coffea canephora]